MSNIKTLRVTGEGSVITKQDKTRLLITLKDSCRTYNEAIQKITDSSAIVRDVLMEKDCGFDHDDIKTLSFDVKRYERRVERQYEKETRTEYVVTFDPIHVLKVEFENNNERLGLILDKLCSLTRIQPTVDVDYFVSELSHFKEEALKSAVADAKSKAVLLASASEVILCDIIDISYCWDTVKIHSFQSPMKFSSFDGACASERKQGISTDFVADDSVISNTVNIVWRIRDKEEG